MLNNILRNLPKKFTVNYQGYHYANGGVGEPLEIPRGNIVYNNYTATFDTILDAKTQKYEFFISSGIESRINQGPPPWFHPIIVDHYEFNREYSLKKDKEYQYPQTFNNSNETPFFWNFKGTSVLKDPIDLKVQMFGWSWVVFIGLSGGLYRYQETSHSVDRVYVEPDLTTGANIKFDFFCDENDRKYLNFNFTAGSINGYGLPYFADSPFSQYDGNVRTHFAVGKNIEITDNVNLSEVFNFDGIYSGYAIFSDNYSGNFFSSLSPQYGQPRTIIVPYFLNYSVTCNE